MKAVLLLSVLFTLANSKFDIKLKQSSINDMTEDDFNYYVHGLQGFW